MAGAVLRAGAVGEDGGDPAAPVDEDSDEPLSPEERFLYQVNALRFLSMKFRVLAVSCVFN